MSINRFGTPPSKRLRREPGGESAIDVDLASVALMIAKGYHDLGRSRSRAIADIIKAAQDGFDAKMDDEVTTSHELSPAEPVISPAGMFSMIYDRHSGELGRPAGCHARERCVAMVRRALEAVPNFADVPDFGPETPVDEGGACDTSDYYPTPWVLDAGYMVLSFPAKHGYGELPVELLAVGVKPEQDGSFNLTNWSQARAFFRAFPDSELAKAYAEMYVDPFADDPTPKGNDR